MMSYPSIQVSLQNWRPALNRCIHKSSSMQQPAEKSKSKVITHLDFKSDHAAMQKTFLWSSPWWHTSNTIAPRKDIRGPMIMKATLPPRRPVTRKDSKKFFMMIMIFMFLSNSKDKGFKMFFCFQVMNYLQKATNPVLASNTSWFHKWGRTRWSRTRRWRRWRGRQCPAWVRSWWWCNEAGSRRQE